MAPSAQTIGFLINATNPYVELDVQDVAAASNRLRRKLVVLRVATRNDLEQTFATVEDPESDLGASGPGRPACCRGRCGGRVAGAKFAGDQCDGNAEREHSPLGSPAGAGPDGAEPGPRPEFLDHRGVEVRPARCPHHDPR